MTAISNQCMDTKKMTLEETKTWLRHLGNKFLGDGICKSVLASELLAGIEQNDYVIHVGSFVIEQATAMGWKRGDPEDAFTFMMRHCREVAIEDAASAAWNKFIRHLNESEPLMAKYKVINGEQKMVSSESHKVFCGSIDHYRKIFLEANGDIDTAE